ncbi:MAG: 16S rRNA (cytosine(967)-C(5))-methyltransferase RsmB [Rudaea sp.]|uniref:16S rRNA (cytosine(967)-C(5))-methyltransferase RsmB n=1 Tax=unclassified Rudaea TaxID=2627037 RepID=UPI0010F4C119|nr:MULTISPECIES: 16S rRNA (cytosine(967)-C(5))-methyltransferase RsmB [unclassified Rudaea]MBN8885254.1 16S rRNA (cytosine(967)-C(5))-methyltransferase RsmB [Rudaea sp.]
MNARPPQAADVRAIAAQALARIVHGESLRTAFAASSGKLADARDRALLSSLLHEGARWWLRYDAALDRLLERPLREREAQVHALAVLGLVQLDVLRLPEYAAVAATVEAARALRKPKFAGLVNALLRRWLRERDSLIAQLDADPLTRSAHPAWLLEALRADWPEQADAIVAANNAQAPLWLRVNRRRVRRDDLLARLTAAGVEAQADTRLEHAIVLAQSADVTRLPGYAEGEFSVQDGAAQFAAGLLDLADGQRVLDACAAPGGKSAHILESAQVKLVALDADARRLPRVAENFSRLGVASDVRAGNAAEPAAWWDGRPFDRILIDAPCSASGIVRRQPDIKLHRRADDIPRLVAEQARILDALWPLLGKGGRLVYATCSVLAEENARQIARALARHGDARIAAAAPDGWHRPEQGGAQNLPGERGMDGFYYAVLEKVH